MSNERNLVRESYDRIAEEYARRIATSFSTSRSIASCSIGSPLRFVPVARFAIWAAVRGTWRATSSWREFQFGDSICPQAWWTKRDDLIQTYSSGKAICLPSISRTAL